jgi:hypothetical protein
VNSGLQAVKPGLAAVGGLGPSTALPPLYLPLAVPQGGQKLKVCNS